MGVESTLSLDLITPRRACGADEETATDGETGVAEGEIESTTDCGWYGIKKTEKNETSNNMLERVIRVLRVMHGRIRLRVHDYYYSGSDFQLFSPLQYRYGALRGVLRVLALHVLREINEKCINRTCSCFEYENQYVYSQTSRDSFSTKRVSESFPSYLSLERRLFCHTSTCVYRQFFFIGECFSVPHV